MPESMPPLLEVKTGLPTELLHKKIVFEYYAQTRMNTGAGYRLYTNGDYYHIYLGSGESLATDTIAWEKEGTISSIGIEQIESIANKSLVDYLNEGPHEFVNGAMKNTYWYFYGQHPRFAETQSRVLKKGNTPAFVNEIEGTLKEYLTPE